MSEEEFNKMFANNLRDQLKKNGMTQKELADLLEVSVASVGYWCCGTKIPRANKIDKICEVLKCTRSDLMSDGKEEEKEKTEPKGIAKVMTNEEHKQIFAQNLKHLLYEKQLTQYELARMMGLSASTINSWYMGQKLPRAEKIDRLCQILICERGDLLENPDARTQKAYYTDKEGAKLAQEMLDRPELRTLMKAAKNVSPESLKAIMTLIEMNYPGNN